MTTPIRPRLQTRKVPIWSLKKRYPRIDHQPQQCRHGIRPHINDRGVAYSDVNSRCTGAPSLHKPLPTVHPHIRLGNHPNLRHTKSFPRQIGMYPSGSACILEAEEGIHRSTDPPAFLPGKAYYPPDAHKRLCNRRYSQPIQQVQHSQTSRLLLARILPC